MSKGDGTITKRSKGVYQVQVSFGTNPVTGKRERAVRTVHGTMADARKVRDELRRQHDEGVSIEGQKMTFAELSGAWLERKRSTGQLAATTLDDYSAIVETTNAVIGQLKVQSITAKTVEDFYGHMRSERGMSETRLNKYNMVLGQIFKMAVRYDLIMRNPLDRVETPKTAASKRGSLSIAESARLRNVLARDIEAEYAVSGDHNPEVYALSMLRASRLWVVRLALATGMRRGEIMGLQWEHVDFGNEVLHVSQSLNCHGDLKAPKTQAGVRVVALDADTLQELRRWKREQREMLADLCAPQTAETPVCCSATGTFQNTSNFEHWWIRYRRRIGFDGLKLHELRHTQATQLLAHGVDVKTVQHRLGHSNASLTLNWYAHALPENDRKAADLFGKMLEESDGESNVVELPKSA